MDPSCQRVFLTPTLLPQSPLPSASVPHFPSLPTTQDSGDRREAFGTGRCRPPRAWLRGRSHHRPHGRGLRISTEPQWARPQASFRQAPMRATVGRNSAEPPCARMGLGNLRGGMRVSVVDLQLNESSGEDLPQVRVERGRMRSPYLSGGLMRDELEDAFSL